MSSLVCGMLKFAPPWVYLLGAFYDAALVSGEPFSAALGCAMHTHLKVGRAAEHWDAHPFADAASLDMPHPLRRCISTFGAGFTSMQRYWLQLLMSGQQYKMS